MIESSPPPLEDSKRAVEAPASAAREGGSREEARSGAPPAVEVVSWSEELPWLVQGVTTRGSSAGHSDGRGELDLRLSGEVPVRATLDRWTFLTEALAMESVVVARQPHGPTVRTHRLAAPGIHIAPDCDGHLTRDPGLLLAVTVGDCVPVFLVAPGQRLVALLHAGWRGIAAGILERGIHAFEERFGIDPDELLVHLGPAICGSCYEVGPEVHRALHLPDPGRPIPLDLRAILWERAARAGVPPERIGASAYCTVEDPRFFSHRGGDLGRQVAYLGVRAGGDR